MHTHICTWTCIHTHTHTDTTVSTVYSKKVNTSTVPKLLIAVSQPLHPTVKNMVPFVSHPPQLLGTAEKQRVERATIREDSALMNPFNHKMEINQADYIQE